MPRSTAFSLSRLPLRRFPLVATLVASMSAASFAQVESPVTDKADEGLQTLPDFKLEEILAPDRKENISFISLAKDDKGRLLVGAQHGQPILRLTIENGKVVKEERLKLPITEAMGMVYAFDSLYIDGSDNAHFGLFRCRDTKGTGEYDSVEMIHEWPGGGGEHGAHTVTVGPDKKIYTVCGNFTDIPADRLASSPVQHYEDDRVLPRAEDGNGFGAGKKPPGGFVTRFDPDGKNAELFAAGERNTYGVAWNPDGELVGFDSDMEWDWGTPWYRPIRIFHATGGADMGFREGSAKWPTYYPDSLPPVVEIGVGSPTGVTFGTGAKFPARFQKAFYALDWTYGRLIVAFLKPNGASYDATWDNFVAPKGLHTLGNKQANNLTGVVVGDDGALYFTTGGRGTQPRLFRVTYTGAESTAAADLHDKDGAEARALRHSLEAFQGRADPKALEAAWKQLGSDDRFIRYAARIAVESQPIDQWKDKALAETNPQAALTALLSVARLGGHDLQASMLEALAKLHMSSLSEQQQLEKLRVLEVSISRNGKPDAQQQAAIVAELNPMYPAQSEHLNRELCQVLLALDAPDSVARTVKLLETAPTQEEQVGYAMFLRTISKGWTPELREAYFNWFTRPRESFHHPESVVKWFTDAGRTYDDGASYPKFISNMHADAVKTLSPEEQKDPAIVAAIDAYKGGSERPKHVTKARKLVKEWKMEDLEPSLADVTHGRNFNRGRAVFEEAQCLACHRFGNDGGAVGPDLTAVSSRFARRDILESIILPSKVISEQYMDTLVRLKNGDVVTGRVMEETDSALVVRPNPLKPDRQTIRKSDINLRKLSNVSPMPAGLINTFHQDEILDLLAYLESGGNKAHPDFKK